MLLNYKFSLKVKEKCAINKSKTLHVWKFSVGFERKSCINHIMIEIDINPLTLFNLIKYLIITIYVYIF